ncbi:DExH-box ATP-dependent RNA helicase DExH5, mitochondrial-like isoform X2 [Diaphorina citri]|uniref:DExH-box ATP-dependent RNA helicase DExH5, mitochondrial-like isoform X2 n=1 Tax=Diaphorina citri TaxID=121845 RepID=A0A1S4E8S5_DIACI|nr:DExH-box ATP-dependent RNA helicase DExH5, mitochondrial-like isoform X2 [Diaphorina citri]
MGRNEMIRKRNTVLKINRKQEKKDRIREKHFEKKTLRYKRPLLKVEESFRKLEKAKHVDKLKTLIHQNVRVNTKFMHKYHLDLFGTQPISCNRKRTDSLASNGELYQEHVNTDENTNIWYIPQEDALCFHLDEYIQTLTAEKIDRVTSHVQSEMKESYQNYLNMSIGDLLDRDLNINSRTEELSSSSLADHMDYMNTACTASNISAEKQTALCDLIDRNQVIVVGSSRDDLNAFTQVPLLLLGHLLNSDSPTQARIVCSTPHQLTAQLAAKSLTKHLHSIVDLDVGFKKKNSPDCTNPILFCTNDHLMYYILDHLALTQVSHIILDRAQHRNDMFDLILLYLRLVLLPRRPDLKLIILSSPMFMEIFAKNFEIPYLKLSKVRKSNPVLYLENILKETR